MSDAEILAGLDFEIGEAGTGFSLVEMGEVALLDEFEELTMSLSGETIDEVTLLNIQQRHATELEDFFVLERARAEVTEFDALRPNRRLLNPDAPYRACVFRGATKRDGQIIDVLGVRFITYGAEEIFNVPVVVDSQPCVPFGGFHADVVDRQVRELRALRDEGKLPLTYDLTRLETEKPGPRRTLPKK